MSDAYSIAAFGHHPDLFAERSGMFPLADALGAERVYYDLAWEKVSERSWQLGRMLQRWGNTWYGSEWNAVVPVLDEWRLARRVDVAGPHVNLFLWGEFFTPRNYARFRRSGHVNIGCFHATAWRQQQVLSDFKSFDFYDRIVLMSETQRDFLLERGVPEEKVEVFLHGVDTEYYRPIERFLRKGDGPLCCIMVGGTERDHVFLASVLKALPEGVVQVQAAIPPGQVINYKDAPHIEMTGRLSDEDFLKLYQEADLLLLPMNDCTANNTVMEAMACGTPVLTNAVGGIPEYVSSEGGIVLKEKKVEEWTQTLIDLSRNRGALWDRRPVVREWAERFDWEVVAEQYKELFRVALSAKGCLLV